LAEVTTLASDLAANIYDIEIAHSVNGEAGVLMLTVEGSGSKPLVQALKMRDYRVHGRFVAGEGRTHANVESEEDRHAPLAISRSPIGR
jgi:hypothetical protein